MPSKHVIHKPDNSQWQTPLVGEFVISADRPCRGEVVAPEALEKMTFESAEVGDLIYSQDGTPIGQVTGVGGRTITVQFFKGVTYDSLIAKGDKD